MSDLETQWGRVQGRLRAEFGDAAFNSWLKPLALVNVESGRVHIAVPTRFMRDWVQSHYVDRIRDFWSIENPEVDGVEIRVASAMKMRAQPAAAVTASQPVLETVLMGAAGAAGRASPAPAPAAQPASYAADSDEGEDIGAPLDHRFTFDSFVVGKSNELAYAAARRVAENSAVNFNPLFLHGGVGLGKTHLMHAIAWHIRRRDPNRRVIYMSAEKFMYQFVSALRYKDTMAFKQKFRAVDVLMIDDVQFIANKNSTQEEFFHTFNALIDHHRQVVISADRSPSDLEGIEERIRSRLGWGLVADIHPTDYELRLGILQQKVDSMPGADVPVPVMEFLARRISSNVRELEGAINRIIAHATLIGRPITMEMTQEVLQDLLRANDRRVTIDDIQRKVAEYYNLRLADLLSARRARTVARPRQVAMFLSKQLTTRSLPDIGRKFGGRDHTTVIHAVKRIEELVQTDGALEEDIHHLRRMLEG
ncbi:chromosomal replication initiator protein DnaA [Govanella unica]|uniref:Chromosomal replication initiator protein DnaA n=1 Tax=Govanella unica TaxID=2975056 RepID=A0A9X3Z7V2_9PROT|nr:chromosomal replication initiator protein DnaA [Govania unica]MDA5194640.1 chromosomal replication initiator protein DnaA [Govania unica]